MAMEPLDGPLPPPLREGSPSAETSSLPVVVRVRENCVIGEGGAGGGSDGGVEEGSGSASGDGSGEGEGEGEGEEGEEAEAI